MVQIEEEPEEAKWKQVHFEPKVGQPSVHALKKQGNAKGKGKILQEPRIIEIHSDNDSVGEPAKFLRELPHTYLPNWTPIPMGWARSTLLQCCHCNRDLVTLW